MNTAGMHVPLWMDSAAPSIGWGQNPAYPVQEAAYFGNVMRANSDGSVHAWYCEGRNYTNGIVPGTFSIMKAIWPATRSASAGAPPL